MHIVTVPEGHFTEEERGGQDSGPAVYHCSSHVALALFFYNINGWNRVSNGRSVFVMKKSARNTNITAVASSLSTKDLCIVDILLVQGFIVIFSVHYILMMAVALFIKSTSLFLKKKHVKKYMHCIYLSH
jgi:hypothetical protein